MNIRCRGSRSVAWILWATCALVVSGCIFANDGEDGGSDAGDTDVGDAADTVESDAGDVEEDVDDVSDTDDASDADDASDTDTGSEFSCPDDCTLAVQYRNSAGSLEELDGATLQLFSEVELVATPSGVGDENPTGCDIEWSLDDSVERVRFRLDESTDRTDLLPVALAAGGDQTVTATASCDEGDISMSAGPSVEYPATVPDNSSGQPAPFFWWSAPSDGSAGRAASNGDVWQWRTVDPTQQFFFGIRNEMRVPKVIAESGRPQHIAFEQDDTLRTRLASDPATNAHIQEEVTIILRVRLARSLELGESLALIERCAGPNNQLRMDTPQESDQSLEVAFDGELVGTTTSDVLQSRNWYTVAMVWENQSASLYLDGTLQNSSPLEFPQSSESRWSWDHLLRGCRIERPDASVDVSDVIVVEAALSESQISNVIDGFIAASVSTTTASSVP